MWPEVVVVDGTRHERRGLRCAIGASSDAAAGWGRSGVAAAPAGASRAGVRVGGAMGAGAGALAHVCVLVLYHRFLQESGRREAPTVAKAAP